MNGFAYPALFRFAEDGVTVTFRDLPEAITSGEDLADAVEEGADCLAEALAGRIMLREEIPVPSRPRRGERLVPVPLYLAPKLALYLAMREARINNSQLARKLGVSELVVRRMLNPRHDTKPEKLQRALAALGKQLVVAAADAA